MHVVVHRGKIACYSDLRCSKIILPVRSARVAH